MTAKPKKTVAIVQTQAENAGAQEVARQLANGFEKHGWRTRQIFFFRRTDSFDGEDNVVFCARTRPSSPRAIMRMIGALYREFRREKPDVIITLQHYGNVIAAPVAKLCGGAIVVANQISPPELIPAPVGLLDRLMGAVGFFDHIVVNSAQTEAAYRGYPDAYTRRLKRIDHGFFDKSRHMTKAEARAALDLPPDAEILGCAARLSPLKRLELAIDLLTQDSRQHLALAGQGPEFDRLVARANALGVSDRVHFLGELDLSGMGAFLAALDCFVFPSAVETFGLAPVEAAQAGVPLVVNDIEVLRGVLAVEGEPCALFVDAADTPAFAAAVRKLLDDTALRKRLTDAGGRLAQRYPLDAMIKEYLALTPNGAP